MSALLERLEALCGMDPHYDDTAGVRHEIPAASRRALLAAMGFDVRDDDTIAGAIETLESSRWRRRLPPIALVDEDAPTFELPLSLPATELGEAIAWTLTLEDGHTSGGTIETTRLQAEDSRTFDGETWLRATITLPAPSALGYHRLQLIGGPRARSATASCLVIAAPARCYRAQLDGGTRLWGLTVQVYGLRSAHNWGIGDFTDLLRLVEYAAEKGAAFVGVNPLHVPIDLRGEAPSPYFPSSRRFINPVYIDVEAVPDFAECDAARAYLADESVRARLSALRATDLVDYAGVTGIKLTVLEHLYTSFRERHLSPKSARGQAFTDWCRARPEVRDFAVFAAIDEAMRAGGGNTRGWPDWPVPLRQRGSAATARWAESHRERIDFHAWLQWHAKAQLAAAHRRARELGMPIGIYTDLALSPAPGGADTWIDPELYISGVHIGAPPDEFNQAGQDWGLSPADPEKLRAAGYRPLIETLRAGMHLGGALRIDHVMWLMRLYLLPATEKPDAGAYINYRLDELSAIVALESRRNECVVIGEDLGTVPATVRRRLGNIGALGYRVLYFEKDAAGAFRAPAAFDREALTVVSTHDLPTLAGFWSAADLEQRRLLDLFPTPAQREQQVVLRAEDRARLLLALEKHGYLEAGACTPEQGAMTTGLACAVHAFLADSASLLVGVQAEDLLGQVEQVNLPGTTTAHPNWRRRLPLSLEHWREDEKIETLLATVRARRPSAAAPGTTAPEGHAGAQQRRAIVPDATYRVQLQGDFTFRDLERYVPYLARLGVSHCYCSPYLKARPGSRHGYDIVDHSRLNPEIGDENDLAALTGALRRHGLGQILDMVPNHMAVMGSANAWWLDVLEHGQSSKYAHFFDIDWRPLKAELRGKVLVPVLGDHYGNVLDAGELRLVFAASEGALLVDYHEHRFPLDPREYPRVLGSDLEQLRQRLGAGDETLAELESLMTALAKLPDRDDRRDEARVERERDARLLKRKLAVLAAESADIRQYIDECLVGYNGSEHYPADPARLHELFEAQAWRLAFWRVAADEINYRRFFDINELASLRVEDDEVFAAVHGYVLSLIEQGVIDGLRIDHPDGLYDPRGYFETLQRRLAAADKADTEPHSHPHPHPQSQSQSQPPGARDELPLYLIIEKILAPDEALREDWAVHGTTGYEFSSLIDRLLLDGDGLAKLAAHYEAFVGRTMDYGDLRYRSKRLIMNTSLASELGVLTADLDRLAEQDPHTRDFGLGGLRNALVETIAAFPVYRTYAVDGEVSAADEHVIRAAVEAGKAGSEAADTSVFDFLRDVLLNRTAAGQTEALRRDVAAFAMRMQQYTSPVAAKGIEDTACYRYGRLLSLNEVGSSPDGSAANACELHAANRSRLAAWPHALLASSTHDSKRSEDVRARLAVLSELPDEWGRLTARWRERNARIKRAGTDSRHWPDRNIEYLLYQTLVGAWPLGGLGNERRADFSERMSAYMVKAAREAKEHTSWIHPDADYETALTEFTAALLDPARAHDFLQDLERFADRAARLGLLNALTGLVLKLTCPGVPDIYQGNELWRFDLVDPDNRRPVDFARRDRLLGDLERRVDTGQLGALARELMNDVTADALKLFVTWRVLRLRRQHARLFARGDYQALQTFGEHRDRTVAFTRHSTGTTLAVVTLTRFAPLTNAAGNFDSSLIGDTSIELPSGLDFCDCLTGARIGPLESGSVRVGLKDLLATMPCAVLLATSQEHRR